MRKTQWSSCGVCSFPAGLAGGLPLVSGEQMRAGEGGTAACAAEYSMDPPGVGQIASGTGQAQGGSQGGGRKVDLDRHHRVDSSGGDNIRICAGLICH